MHPTGKSLFKRVSIFIGMLAIAAVPIFFTLSHKAALYNELVGLDLIPQDESVTELYFNNKVPLPDTATGNQEVRFAFVIHNLETTDMQYAYAVSVIVDDGTKHIVDHGNVLVKINHYSVKSERIRLLNSVGKQEVVVELTNKRQSIDFWIAK